MSRFGLFCASGFAYAIPLPLLLQVVSGERCYLLPKLPKSVAGVVVWGGQLIVQLDPARLLGGPVEVIGPADYLVLVASECGILALSADQTCGIVTDQAGELVLSTEKKTPGIIGEFSFLGTVFNILDVESLAIDLTQESW